MNRFGRKYTTIILFVLTALSSFLITIGYVSKMDNAETMKTVCAIISRLFLDHSLCTQLKCFQPCAG